MQKLTEAKNRARAIMPDSATLYNQKNVKELFFAYGFMSHSISRKFLAIPNALG
jgi:hypothetical protein